MLFSSFEDRQGAYGTLGYGTGPLANQAETGIAFRADIMTIDNIEISTRRTLPA